MLTKDKVYTHEELKKFGLEKSRESFGEGEIFTRDNQGYIMDRVSEGYRLFFKFNRS